MTSLEGLPPRPSVYDSPAVDPAQMTPKQKAAFRVAQVAAAVEAASIMRKQITDGTVLTLIPLLRSLNPFNDDEVAEFARKAAEIVEMGRQQAASVAWGSVSTQLGAYDINLTQPPREVGPGRATDLDIAYRRVANDYRRRIAAGTESIQESIARVEAERFAALGGEQANAEVEEQGRAPGEGERAPQEAGGEEAGGGARKSGPSARDRREAQRRAREAQRAQDRAVNTTADDEEAADIRRQRAEQEQRDREANEAVERADEIARRARLNNEKRLELLAQIAEQEMEVRAERMVNDDIGMASRQGAKDALNTAPQGKIRGYRRVLHPELSEYGSCGLCVVASTRVYKKSELMPMHNLCKCEVVVVYTDADPGNQINDEDLDVFYNEAGFSTSREALKQQTYEVFDHPELGPVLRNTKHSKKDIEFSSREPSAAHKAKFTGEQK